MTTFPRLSATQTIALSYGVGSLARLILYAGDFWRNQYLPRELIFDKTLASEIMFKGFSIFIRLFIELWAVNFLSYLVHWQLPNTTENLMILNAMNQYNLLAAIPTVSLGIAACVLISNHLRNTQQYSDAARYSKAVLAMSTFYNLCCLLLGLVIPQKLARLFLNPNQITNHGINGDLRGLFIIVFIGLLFNSYRDVVSGLLRALNIYKPPTTASIISMWCIGMSLAAILAKPLGIAGILIGYYTGATLGSVYLLNLWCKVSSEENVEKIDTQGSEVLNAIDCYLFNENEVFQIVASKVTNQIGTFFGRHNSNEKEDGSAFLNQYGIT